MKRLNDTFLNLTIATLLGLLAGAVAVDAQARRTVAEARADHNEAVCLTAKLAKGCTQAQVAAAQGTGTIYATDAAFRDAELLPAILAKRTEERNNRASEALNRAFQSLTPAKRVAVCTAAELPDPEVCR